MLASGIRDEPPLQYNKIQLLENISRAEFFLLSLRREDAKR